MSLFPAYSSETQQNEPPKQHDEWLNNSSFQVDPQILHKLVNKSPDDTKSSSDSETGQPKAKKRKKKDRKHTKDKDKPVEPQEPQNLDFVIDSKPTKEFLTVQTISRPSAPKYRVAHYLTLGFKVKKRKLRRYYKLDFDKTNSDEQKVTKLGDSNVLQEEENLSKTTASYNKSLGDNPNDIKMWMEYIKFQDTLYQFEKVYKKGSMAKAQRVLAERKLSIIDKALTHNPNCEIFLRERLNVAVSCYPADELQVQLKNLIEKDQGNIIFWQGYIEATQCSMSHCNTPAVLNLYSKCLAVLHKLRRSTSVAKPVLEESILRMLYQCGLFLKQAGLFEQLWTLLRMYLELNLSPANKNKFNIASTFNERQLVDLEELVLSSELPLHELWLRTEKLRESCHWLPYTEQAECEDPQRIVFMEDVNELIHPITMPENTFKMIATILTLLKIPLLPCSHITMQELGLDYVPWALDSIESLLPLYMPVHNVPIFQTGFLSDHRLANGPQYLKVLPGQEDYLEFILSTMKNCFECLQGVDKIAVTVWWIRFQRLLVILNNINLFKMTSNLRKKIKGNLKSLLKEEENRTNKVYFCEYALLEGDLESKAKSISVLESIRGGKVEFNLDNPPTDEIFILRNLVELSMRDDKQKALSVLCSFVLQRQLDEVNEAIIQEAKTKFKLVTLQLINREHNVKEPVQHFLPNFFINWIICQGWLWYLTGGIVETGTFLEDVLEKLEEKDESPSWYKETIYEFYVATLYIHYLDNKGSITCKLLDDVLIRALERYPNNLSMLGVLAKQQITANTLGYKWWKIESMLLKTGRSFPTLIAILVPLQIYTVLQNNIIDTITGK